MDYRLLLKTIKTRLQTTSSMIATRNHFFLLWILPMMFSYIPFSSSKYDSIRRGISLSVEKADDVLTSQNGEFTAGFYPVGNNAYCFAIWFSKPSCCLRDCTVVWMANRDEPVNGKHSKLTLTKHGNVVLRDARRVASIVWSTKTASMTKTSAELKLQNNGNLVLNTRGQIIWQSFDSPTDTLLPQQVLTRDTPLISSKSQGNYSSGYYQLSFDDDNVLRLFLHRPVISSSYWPDPWKLSWEAERTTYNDSRVAALDIYGNFTSSDDFHYLSSDFGVVNQRILKVDLDGIVRLYSRCIGQKEWRVTGQLISRPCSVHGICGPNSFCMYNPYSGRSCSCLPGYEKRNLTDWTQGCKSKFKSFFDDDNLGADFLRIPSTDFYGNDKGFYENVTLSECKNRCLDMCSCRGFQYKFDESKSKFVCYPKVRLLNGHRSPSLTETIYLKWPKSDNYSYYQTETKNLEYSNLHCSTRDITLRRTYTKKHENRVVRALLIFALALAGLEIMVAVAVFCSLIWTRLDKNKAKQGNHLTATGFRRYTYCELKAATKKFSKEIGRGATGSVYKAELLEGKIGAVKRLNVTSRGEEEFLAEVSIIGNLNHMHLIEMLGYCTEGKHRLLVYEYMEHGSLAENIYSPELDWGKRFDIALGSAKGLAYLHEECLEWVLHCDVKPQNILLDSDYKPKVADFGLSKLLNRGVASKNSEFSRIRGTRGYMAPEWVYNLPITSKVDVYSYGIVLLEMVTGKSPSSGGGEAANWKQMISWVREKNGQETEMASWLREVINPTIEGNFNMKKIEILVAVALQCVEEDKDLRPTMSQVVEMLRCHDNDELQH